MSHQNRLAHETSPYLQQHADNPVDWYPWCAEALDRARREDKPILLSIGYSACHWCHVMAHESFEDPETAGLMNRLFVNIKVDREERPDLDKIYQLAQQVLTQRTGGWPLTMFLTPADHMPFFGGTYFPREPRHGLPPFREVLTRIADAYRERRTDIEEQNASVAEVLARAYGPQASTEPSAIALRNFVSQCAQIFDAKHGGFGRAPKFPHTPQLERLLRYWARNPEDSQARQALDMLRFTLAKMSSGGIFDHLAGGFCRYSVDDYWMIPHFEKMLYDNGPLLALYAEASVALDDAAFRNAAHATARWMMREMQAAEGGYFSSLDADSEGVEGKFYVWTPDEVRALLTQEEYVLFARRFGLDRAANFEGEWHLHAYESLRTVSEESGLDEARVASLLESGRRKLLSVREQRVHPSRDEKILTSWNALAIRGMAVAAQRLSNPEYLDSAERALTFIHGALWKEGHLLATYKDGKAHLAAYLDDYAFLIDAILEFLQARWDSGWLDFARKLADVLLEQFEDRSSGGFLFTGEQHESLIQRPRSFSDESMPAGNAIAARALMRLGWLVGETRFIDAADRTIKAGAYAAGESPLAHCALLSAIDEQINPPATVIVRGDTLDLLKWQTRLNQQYRPGIIAYSIPNDAAGLPSALAEKKTAAFTVAYICKGLLCAAPVDSEEALAIALEKL